MRILGQTGGPSSNWNGPGPRFGLVHGFFNNLCTAITSCFYVFCCCWLIEDCFVGRRSYPRPPFGLQEGPEPPPPPHYHVGPEHHGLLGSMFGPSEPPPPPHYHVGPEHQGLLGSMFGPSEPPPPPPPHVGHGLLGSVGGPPGPPGYSAEPSPY